MQVDDLGATVEVLSRAGLDTGPMERPGGPDGPRTSWLTDPDGYRIELVQGWLDIPAGLPLPTSLNRVLAGWEMARESRRGAV